MMEFWLSIIFGVLLVIQSRRHEKYKEYSEKTIFVLRLCVAEHTEQMKQLNDLLLTKLPHLKPQVDAAMDEWKKQRTKEQELDDSQTHPV